MLVNMLRDWSLVFFDTFCYVKLLKEFSLEQREEVIKLIIENKIRLVISDEILYEVTYSMKDQEEYKPLWEFFRSLTPSNLVKIRSAEEIYHKESQAFFNNQEVIDFDEMYYMDFSITDNLDAVQSQFYKKRDIERSAFSMLNAARDIRNETKNQPASLEGLEKQPKVSMKKIKKMGVEEVVNLLKEQRFWEKAENQPDIFKKLGFDFEVSEEQFQEILKNSLDLMLAIKDQDQEKAKECLSVFKLDQILSHPIFTSLQEVSGEEALKEKIVSGMETLNLPLEASQHLHKLSFNESVRAFQRYVHRDLHNNPDIFKKFKKAFNKEKAKKSFLEMPAIHIDNILVDFIEKSRGSKDSEASGNLNTHSESDRKHSTAIPYVDLFYGDTTTITQLDRVKGRGFTYSTGGHKVLVRKFSQAKGLNDFDNLIADLNEVKEMRELKTRY